MTQTGQLIEVLVGLRELVTMMAAIYPAPLDVEEALRISGAEDFAERQTRKLSGGETQRVRFAIALVADAELLVLDEPTVALDVEVVGISERHARLRRSSKTVIFATPLSRGWPTPTPIASCLMSHGRIVADGAPTEIKATVGGRLFVATLPDVDLTSLQARCAGVTLRSIAKGDAVTLIAADSDATLRDLLTAFLRFANIEVRARD